MATNNVAGIYAQVEFEPVKADNGCTVMFPRWESDYYRARGITRITLTFELNPACQDEPWLRVTEAAQIYLNEEIVFGTDLKDATRRVSEACDRGHIEHTGNGVKRRIKPDSLRRWMLDRRRHDNKDNQ